MVMDEPKPSRAERASQGWPADRPVGDDYTAAATVGVSRSKWWQLVSAHEAPAPIRIGRRSTRWRRSDVFAWLEARPIAQSNSLPQSPPPVQAA
jgi:predicted DNA-binding transcriptional regulator AlpA